MAAESEGWVLRIKCPLHLTLLGFVLFALSALSHNQIRRASPTASFVLIAPGEMRHTRARGPISDPGRTWRCSVSLPQGRLHARQIEHYISARPAVGRTRTSEAFRCRARYVGVEGWINMILSRSDRANSVLQSTPSSSDEVRINVLINVLPN